MGRRHQKRKTENARRGDRALVRMTRCRDSLGDCWASRQLLQSHAHTFLTLPGFALEFGELALQVVRTHSFLITFNFQSADFLLECSAERFHLFEPTLGLLVHVFNSMHVQLLLIANTLEFFDASLCFGGFSMQRSPLSVNIVKLPVKK